MLNVKRISSMLALGLIGFTTAASAADLDPPLQQSGYGGWYMRGDVGAAITDADGQPRTDDGFALGAGIGYRFNDMLRGDVTFDGAFDFDVGPVLGSSIDAYSLMANLYYDIPLAFMVQPYIGGGIGWGEVDGGAFDDDGVALAGMAGLTYDLPTDGAIDIGYRLRYIDINTAASDHWLDHSFRIGFRFGF